MLCEDYKDRSYHSEDKRRSISRGQARQYKLEKVKLRFKNIATRIKQIKKQNTSDLTQLNSLKRGSEEIQKMAHQSLEKATLFLSESKLQRKRVASPSFHEAKHAQLTLTEFNPAPSEEVPAIISPRGSAMRKKAKNGKGSVIPAQTKTDETSGSEPQRQDPVKQIQQNELPQQQSAVRIEESSGISHQPVQGLSPNQQQVEKMEVIPPISNLESLVKEKTYLEEPKELKQNISNFSMLKSGSKFPSTQGSLRVSLQRSSNPPQKTRSQGIYPYIATIIISIIFLFILRG